MSFNAPKTALKGYQWPADKLTIVNMQLLCELRDQTGLPINQLIKLAIEILPQHLAANNTDKSSA